MRIREKINHEMKLLEREIKNCQRQLNRKSRKLATIQRLVPLHSVGTFLDARTGLVCPMLTNGDPDMNPYMATHIDDVDEWWLRSLDEADTEAVTALKMNFK